MALLFLSLMTGGLGAWLIMKIGPKIGIIDIPNKRSSHACVVPKGGGIGILTAFIICAFSFNLPVSFWMSCLTISLLSLWGDRHEIQPVIRLFIQFGCSLVFLMGLYLLNAPLLTIGFLSIPLSFFLTGTANFYNFMDGIDGIAGIAGVVGFSLLALFSWFEGDGGFGTYGLLCLNIALSCVGFLFFNLSRAKVFMGDGGSIFLGFLFSCMVILLSENFIDFFIMVGFLFPFYFDELITMVVRLNMGESLLKPHRRHIYQLLANEMEIPHWQVSFCYGVIQLIIGFSLIILKPKGIYFILLSYLIYIFIFIFISIFIRKKVVLNQGNIQ
jgi:Fuc2NAc and GlcNAc transferase